MRRSPCSNECSNAFQFGAIRQYPSMTRQRSDQRFPDVVVQRRTACRRLTRKGSQVQILHRPPLDTKRPFGVSLETLEGAFKLVGQYGTVFDGR